MRNPLRSTYTVDEADAATTSFLLAPSVTRAGEDAASPAFAVTAGLARQSATPTSAAQTATDAPPGARDAVMFNETDVAPAGTPLTSTSLD